VRKRAAGNLDEPPVMDKARYRYLSDGFEVKKVERTGE